MKSLLTFALWFIIAWPITTVVIIIRNLRRAVSYPHELQFTIVETNDPRVRAEIRAFWELAGNELIAAGFTPLVRLLQQDALGGEQAGLWVFVNTEGVRAAAECYVCQRPGKTPTMRTAVEYWSETLAGQSVCTNNGDVSLTSQPPWRILTQIPRLRDIGALYRVHQAQLRTVGGVRRDIPDANTLLTQVQEEGRREFRRWLERGVVYEDKSDNRLRYTWKGAICTASRLVWPVTRIRQRRAVRRGRRLLQALGLPPDYPTVDYGQLVRQKLSAMDLAQFAAPIAATNAPPVLPTQPASPTAPPEALACAYCKAALHTEFWSVDGRAACAACHASLTGHGKSPGGWRRAWRASGAGVAATLCSIIILIVLGLSASSPAVIVATFAAAILIGWAVRWGAQRRGGWRYQLLAVGLTYLALGTGIVTIVAGEIVNAAAQPNATATDDNADSTDYADDTDISDDTPTAAEIASTFTPTSQPQPPDLADAISRLVRAILTLAMVGLMAPVILAVQSTVGFGFVTSVLMIAWWLNKRPKHRIVGPHPLDAPPDAPPGAAGDIS